MRPPLIVVLVALAALVLAKAGGGSTRGARSACQDSCQATFDDALMQACPGCASPIIDDRDSCTDAVTVDQFDACVARCATFPSPPGRCTVTRGCTHDCRASRTSDLGVCQQTFKHRIRTECAGGKGCLVAARKARHQCVRECRVLSARTTVPRRARAAAGGCNCQGKCVQRFVSSCYADCADNCNGDSTALDICRRGCRNAQCATLRNACTDSGTGPTASNGTYLACCTACSNCSGEVDCEVTTTSTSTSSTTSSVIVSTTTVTTVRTTTTTATMPF